MSDADPRAFRIVVSYRRVDTGGDARSLAETLADRFGEDNVFFDIHGIAPGEPFDQVIAKAVEASDVFLACIGPQWLTVAAEDGTRRIDDPEDYVRRELEGALQGDVRVIPVTFGDADMPGEDDLPPSLQPFSKRNAVEVRAAKWHEDAADLVEFLAKLKREKLRRSRKGVRAFVAGAAHDALDWAWHSGRRRRSIVATSAVVLVAVVLGGLALWQLVDDGQAPPVTPEEASAGADAPTLAFSSGSRIFLAGEDGRPQPLPGQGLRKEPDWSPDGTRLAYSQGGDIWTSDLEGGDTVQVTNGPDEDGSPAWSPDGATLAFGRKAGEAPSEIWVVDSGGGEPARVAAGGAPDWSHDGRRLVYQRDFQIWIAAADGTDERSLTADYGGPALFPAWSPDGTRIAFILPDPQPSGCTIVVVKPNGNERQDKDLARPLRCRDVSWSPDGKRLVFAGGDEGIFSVPRLGTDAEQIVDAPGAQNPSWSPTS